MTPVALDIAIGAVIFLSTLIAYFRGIVKEFFTLAGLGLAVFVSMKAGHLLVPGLNKWLGVPLEGSTPTAAEKAQKVLGILAPDLAAKAAAYGGTFLLVFLLMILVGFLITRWIKEAGLGVVDRLLGAGFGFARGFLLVFLVYVPCKYLNDQKEFPDWAKNSISVPILQSTLEWSKTHLDLDKMIEDHGGEIAIKLKKVDIEKLGAETGQAATELKDEVKKEDQEIQKAVPETPPAPVPPMEPSPPPPAPSQPVISPPPASPEPVVVPPASPAPVPAQPETVPVPNNSGAMPPPAGNPAPVGTTPP